MLIRVALAIAPDALQRRISGLLTDSLGVTVGSLPADRWIEELRDEDADLLIATRPPAPSAGIAWVDSVRRLPGQPDVVVLSGSEDPVQRARLLAAGCVAILNHSLGDEELEGALRAIVARRGQTGFDRLQAGRFQARPTLEDFESASASMKEILAVARRVVAADTSVLILGETGVGKERLARAIHQGGPRSSGPFVAVNCGAIPEGLIESELFGHERGAFTGAAKARRGHFELAHGGTIFLDEVGELPLHLQVRLLRALDERAIQRLGSERLTPLDVRVIAATNRDLAAEVAAHRFRPDLYYRLAVVTLTIPPLRERREDIQGLVELYLEHLGTTLSGRRLRATPEATRALIAYAWPGNVRELANVLERAALLGGGGPIGLEHLPPAVVGGIATAAASAAASNDLSKLADLGLRDARRQAAETFERAYLDAVLSRARGRVGRAAALAGVNPRTLYDLMKRHGMDKAKYRG